MNLDSVPRLPVAVKVAELISSRYAQHTRPLSWDERREGIDIVRTESGLQLPLLSDGGQSPPEKGWELVLTEGDSRAGYRWTLFGLPPSGRGSR